MMCITPYARVIQYNVCSKIAGASTYVGHSNVSFNNPCHAIQGQSVFDELGADVQIASSLAVKDQVR